MLARDPSETIDPGRAAALLTEWGFLAESDLPDRPGPAWLLVAMRPAPTLRHFDPELVEYWVSREGRGCRTTLTHADRVPFETEFSWGMVRIVDRLKVSNEYLAFGGQLSAARVDDATIAVFGSPAPLLRRGGHSQAWDPAAESLGAFFGRLTIALDYTPGFESRVAAAAPVARYAAFVGDCMARFRKSVALRGVHPGLLTLMEAEEHRLRQDHPDAHSEGQALLALAGL